MSIERVYNSWFFWPAVALYVVIWIFTWGYWQGKKKGAKDSKGNISFFERYSTWYLIKYPSPNSFFYDLMSVLGPLAFLLYVIFSILLYIVDFIINTLVLVLVFLFFAAGQTILFLGQVIYSLGRKIGSK